MNKMDKYDEKSANFQELVDKYGFTVLTPEERKYNTSINGAVYQFKTEMLPNQHGELKRLEVAHMVTYPDGRSEIFVPDEDAFREAGSTKDQSVVSYLRNDVNQGKSTSADNTVPGVQTVYSNNDTVINYSSPDKRITIIENGKVIQEGQKMVVQPQTLSVENKPNGNGKIWNCFTLVDEDLGTHTRTVEATSDGKYELEYAGKKYVVVNQTDENGQVQTYMMPQDENVRTVASNGYVTNAGSVIDENALGHVMPSVSNSSLAENIAAGMLTNNKKLSDDVVYFTYTTKKDANGKEIPDQWIETDAKGSFLYKHNDYSGGSFDVGLDKNDGKVSFVQDASGNYKVISRDPRIVVIKAEDNEKLNSIMNANNNVNLTNSDDTTQAVRTIQKRFAGSQEEITARVNAEGGSITWNGNQATIYQNGVTQKGTYIEGKNGVSGITGLETNSDGKVYSLGGTVIDPKEKGWDSDMTKAWTSYYDGVKNGTLTGAEKEKAQIKLIEEHGMKLSRNGHLLAVENGKIVETQMPVKNGNQSSGGSVSNNGGSNIDPKKAFELATGIIGSKEVAEAMSKAGITVGAVSNGGTPKSGSNAGSVSNGGTPKLGSNVGAQGSGSNNSGKTIVSQKQYDYVVKSMETAGAPTSAINDYKKSVTVSKKAIK